MSAQSDTEDVMSVFDKLIEEAPEGDPEQPRPQARRIIGYPTGTPKRYRDEWTRPTDEKWIGYFGRLMDRVKEGGTVAMIGNRGTGKTRLAAEAIREHAPSKAHYTTAMEIFLRIQASFDKRGSQTQLEIVKELAQCPLLVIDEVQERGNSAWEDRLLTHILDKRYGSVLPTIIIANLSAESFAEQMGESISSRMNEGGGIITITGKSFRG